MIAYRAREGSPARIAGVVGVVASMQPLADQRDGFDLDEHPGVDEAIDADHRHQGTNISEHLAVGSADLLVAGDVGDVDPNLDDVTDAGSGAAELVLDLAEDLDGLLVGRFADHIAVWVHRRGAADEDELARPGDAREAESALKR
jgi:hypothetical protein